MTSTSRAGSGKSFTVSASSAREVCSRARSSRGMSQPFVVISTRRSSTGKRMAVSFLLLCDPACLLRPILEALDAGLLGAMGATVHRVALFDAVADDLAA